MKNGGRGSGVGSRGLVVLALLAPSAFAQFAFSVGGRPVAGVFDFGESTAVQFRLTNTSDQAAVLSNLSVRGAGFSIDGGPALPMVMAAGAALDFRVVFDGAAVASYSAELAADGVTVLLTASVRPRLTYSPLGAAGLDFGSVDVGGAVTRRITAANLTPAILAAPAVSATGDAFTVAGASAGTPVLPGQSTEFDVVFRPPGAGTWTGALTIDDRSYALTGVAVGLPLPKPVLNLDVAQLTVAVGLDAPAKTAGAGTLTLDFTPLTPGATDPAIQLGIVGRLLPFTISPGDTHVRFGDLDAVSFQTGSTAGTIGIAVELGGATDRKEMVIPAAPVAILTAQAARTAAGIELRIGGVDNTRTAGAVTFTFFDASGAALPAISVDYTRDFAGYFAASDQGGAFLLRSVFPVTGDASTIREFAVQMTNAAGSSTTGRVKF
jgi:hypothetical protein